MYRQTDKNCQTTISPPHVCPHNMVNFGPLTAEIGSPVWGTPANFNRFRVLVLLLQRRRSPEANQALRDVWPSHGYIFGGSCPLTEFRHVQNSLCIQVMCSPIFATLLHSTPAAGSSKLCGMVQGMELRNFRRDLYSAGRPSRWASDHILVVFILYRSSFLCKLEVGKRSQNAAQPVLRQRVVL